MRFIRNVILIAAAYNLAGCGDKSTGDDKETEQNEEEEEVEGGVVSPDAGKLQVGESGCKTKDVELRKKFDENKKRLAALDKQLEELTGSVGTCQTQSSALKAKVDTALDARIKAETARLAKLRESVDDFQIEIEKTQLQLAESGPDAELEEKISDLATLVREDEEKRNNEIISELGKELKIEIDSVEATLAAHKSNMRETQKRRSGKKIEHIQSHIDRLSRDLETLKQKERLLTENSARIVQLSVDLGKIDKTTVEGALAVRFRKLRAQMRNAEAVEREHRALAEVIVVKHSEGALYKAHETATKALKDEGLTQEDKRKNEETASIVTMALAIRQDATDKVQSVLTDVLGMVKSDIQIETEIDALVRSRAPIRKPVPKATERELYSTVDKLDKMREEIAERLDDSLKKLDVIEKAVMIALVETELEKLETSRLAEPKQESEEKLRDLRKILSKLGKSRIVQHTGVESDIESTRALFENAFRDQHDQLDKSIQLLEQLSAAKEQSSAPKEKHQIEKDIKQAKRYQKELILKMNRLTRDGITRILYQRIREFRTNLKALDPETDKSQVEGLFTQLARQQAELQVVQ